MAPLISVVMCCFNAEKYLKDSIDSILNQTFRDFEFIIWNDGSSDSTEDIIKSYKDDRIRYFYHENTGLGMALRLACEEAKGDYIARMDADDISLPFRFDKEIAFLEDHKDYALVSSAVYYIDENGNNLGRSFPCNNDVILKKVLHYSSMIVHPMVMMRRECYLKAGGYVPIIKSQDRLFWSRLAKYGKFYNIISPLGYYRLLNDSLSHDTNPYSIILYHYRNKMIFDEVISDTDVKLYNDLCRYSKSVTPKNYFGKLNRKKTINEYLFTYISPIFGKRNSELFIVSLMNLYYKIKYRKIQFK